MSSLRISGGQLRGRRIAVPPHDLRPTSEKARQAFFNILSDSIQGARFLDLFAGSGIFSFEAVSRGATSAIAIDSSVRAMRRVADTAAELQLPIRTIVGDLFSSIRLLVPTEPIDIVYADPPYDFERYEELLRKIDEDVPLGDSAVVAIEHRRGADPFEERGHGRLEFRRTAVYGNVAISIFDGGRIEHEPGDLD